MRWPPNKAWTSTSKREGYRHFEVKSFGGKGKDRWLNLFPVNNQKINIRVSFKEINNSSKWTNGWIQLPEDEDCHQ